MKNKLRSSLSLKIISLLLALIVVFLIGCGIAALFKHISKYGNNTQIKNQTEEMNESGSSVQELQFHIPINNYSVDGFYDIAGVRYYGDENYEGVAGIDVSAYQPEIDWDAVRASGIEFVMIQAGYRGWGSGELATDIRFQNHIEGALEAGLEVGVYFFSQALTEEEAVEEAQYTLSLIAGYDITYPVVFDWEEVSDESARTNEMNMLMLTSCADAFCRTIKEAGYEPGVYFNQAFGYGQFNLESLSDYAFWLAEYGDTPTFVYDFQMWQYTDQGKVPGVDGDVDLNIRFLKK